MREWTAALDHGFLQGIARLSKDDLRALLVPLCRDLRHAELRLHQRPLHVHQHVREVETGEGPFIAWGNRVRGNPDVAPLLDLLLRRLSGPYVDQLTDPYHVGDIEPADGSLNGWLESTVRHLLGYVSCSDQRGAGVVAFADKTEGRPVQYTAPSTHAAAWYWSSLAQLDDALARDNPERSTLEVLEEAARMLGPQLVVLETARRSASRWQLDCPAHELHRAIVGLPTYADALASTDQEGTRMSREAAAASYHHQPTIPLSRERGNLPPSARRAREFVAGPHGKQFFDMHAKPGTRTRIHVWVASESTNEGGTVQRIYVGYCGEHL